MIFIFRDASRLVVVSRVGHNYIEWSFGVCLSLFLSHSVVSVPHVIIYNAHTSYGLDFMTCRQPSLLLMTLVIYGKLVINEYFFCTLYGKNQRCKH